LRLIDGVTPERAKADDRPRRRTGCRSEWWIRPGAGRWRSMAHRRQPEGFRACLKRGALPSAQPGGWLCDGARSPMASLGVSWGLLAARHQGTLERPLCGLPHSHRRRAAPAHPWQGPAPKDDLAHHQFCRCALCAAV